MYIQSRPINRRHVYTKQTYQSPACIYKADLSIAGMYIQSRPINRRHVYTKADSIYTYQPSRQPEEVVCSVTYHHFSLEEASCSIEEPSFLIEESGSVTPLVCRVLQHKPTDGDVAQPALGAVQAQSGSIKRRHVLQRQTHLVRCKYSLADSGLYLGRRGAVVTKPRPVRQK